MARAKRASDETYNARRRAKRLLARLEREDASAMSESQLRARADYIESVRAQITKSYQNTRAASEVAGARERTQAAAAQLDRMTSTPRKVKSAKERADIFFARQLNLARKGQPSTLGEYGSDKVFVFYAATRRLWRGRDARKRNEYIIRGLGVNSLAEAFEMVLSANEDAIKAAMDSKVTSSLVKGITSENEAFYNEVEHDSEGEDSPPWTSRIVMFG